MWDGCLGLSILLPNIAVPAWTREMQTAMASSSTHPQAGGPDHIADLPLKVRPANLASSTTELSLVPHEGRVSLGTWFGHAQPVKLVHEDTMEVQSLENGHDWQLVFDDEGFGAITDMRGLAAPIVLDTFLHRKLYEADDGTLVVIERHGEEHKLWSLSAKLAEFTRIRVQVRVGPTLSAEDMPAFLLKWPRQQARVMWDSLRFYGLMLLKSYTGQPSKWVWSSTKVEVVCPMPWAAVASKLATSCDLLCAPSALVSCGYTRRISEPSHPPSAPERALL